MSMERLIVKNFGPIKDVDIEIPRLLVFIGDQASGKSTLAKLIYIFKRVPNMLANVAVSQLKQTISYGDIGDFIISELKLHFDSCFFCDDTYIEFVYSEDYRIIVPGRGNTVKDVYLNDKFQKALEDVDNAFRSFRRIAHYGNNGQIQFTDEERLALSVAYGYMQKLGENIGDSSVFEYMRASRAEFSTPSLGLYTSSMDPSVTRQAVNAFAKLLEQVKDIDSAKQSYIDDYIDRRVLPKEYFLKQFGDLNLYEKEYNEVKVYANRKAVLYERLIRVAQKLVGGYMSEREGEGYGITLSKDLSVFVPYFFLSSGQQSMLPIIAGVTLTGSATSVFSEYLPFNSAILEEPEAHIYPGNQFALMKLLAIVLSMNEWSRFVVTTHSPYILSSIHALSAYGLVNGEVDALNDKYDDLAPLDSDEKALGIYLLKDGYAKSLRDEESGLFDTSEIDSVAEEINEVFDESIIADEIKKENA